MPNSLFGTDGVRGVANTELSCQLAFRLGMGAVKYLGERLVVGRDTRRSGEMLESALVAGIMADGGTPLCCGVIPTPAIALITVQEKAAGGVVISASHNPPQYNGIKFFGPDGMKASDDAEDALADFVRDEPAASMFGEGASVGKVVTVADARERYVEHAIGGVDVRLDGMRVVVDCAHGASCVTTPMALERLGAEVVALNTDFDGMDINVGCGSTNISFVASKVRELGADLGIAHDGDADRVLFVDENGDDVDGDQVIAICARDLKERGLLAQNEAVCTVMSNLGFFKAMEALGIDAAITAVGDRYVLQRMVADGAVIGGEQSGHVIFLQHNTTGDGLVTALQLLSVVRRSGKSLSELATVMQRFPQALVNVRTPRKHEVGDDPFVRAAIDAVNQELAGDGRVLVRASGTEPLVRVMVEAPTDELAKGCAQRIAAVIEEHL